MMNWLFLGTGTSVGVPMIACHCPVCTSSDRRNVRRRSAVYVTTDRTDFVIDTPPEFRLAVIENHIESCHAVLFTHAHADHLFGFDDIRRFNTIHHCVLPAYADPVTLASIKRIFSYISDKPVEGLFRAQISYHEVTGPFDLADVHVTPLPVEHCEAMTGYLLDCHGKRGAYIPDCCGIPPSTMALLTNLDVMVLDCLRYRPHKSHFNVEQSLAALQAIGARESYLTHLCHDIDHATLEATLPPHIHIAYDGLKLSFGG